MSRKADAISPASSGPDEALAVPSYSGTRETIESLVIAVVLAMLFRGFVAEAFVIPTGSMATTLFGRHNDVQCSQCDYWYQTGASAENEDRRSGEVLATTCPICRFRMELDKANDPNQRSFDGDRILVSKFDYDLAEPSRWDVFVFKYPANAKQNYIKRLVGLPNEELKIRHGDVYTRPYDGASSVPTGDDTLELSDQTDQPDTPSAAGSSARWQIPATKSWREQVGRQVGKSGRCQRAGPISWSRVLPRENFPRSIPEKENNGCAIDILYHGPMTGLI